MALVLGPIPPSVLTVVRRLITEGRHDPPNADERLNGLLLSGGPGGCSYLDADGEVWHWFLGDNDELVEHVPDGPMKVGLVAIAAERIPELAVWLPRRPATATDCKTCMASGQLPPPNSWMQCPHCFGMGWVSE